MYIYSDIYSVVHVFLLRRHMLEPVCPEAVFYPTGRCAYRPSIISLLPLKLLSPSVSLSVLYILLYLLCLSLSVQYILLHLLYLSLSVQYMLLYLRCLSLSLQYILIYLLCLSLSVLYTLLYLLCRSQHREMKRALLRTVPGSPTPTNHWTPPSWSGASRWPPQRQRGAQAP